MRKIIFSVLFFGGAFLFPWQAWAEIDCWGTIRAWQADKNMQRYMREHRCDCSNGRNRPPVCTSTSSSGSQPGRSYSSGSKKSSRNAWQVQIFQGLLQNFMAGLASEAAAPPSRPDNSKEIARKEAEERQKREARVNEQLAAVKQEYNRLKQEEFERNKPKLVNDLKARLSSGSGKSGGSALRQLNCSAYWAMQAAQMSAEGKHDLAQRYGENSAQARNGAMSEGCSESWSAVPSVPSPEDAEFRTQVYQFLIEEAEDTVLAMNEARERKKDTEEKVTSQKAELDDLKKRRESAEEQQKEGIDKLLAEADQALQEALEADRKATVELSGTETKLSAIQEMYKSINQ